MKTIQKKETEFYKEAGMAIQFSRLASENEYERRGAAAWFGRQKQPRGVPSLIQVMDGDAKWCVRSSAIWAVGQIAKEHPGAAAEALPSIIKILAKYPHPDTRAKAAEAIGLMKNKQGERALIKGLQDPEPEVRKSCAWSLGKLESTKSVRQMAGLLRDDPDWEVRRAVAEALERIRDKRALGALGTAAEKDEDAEVRKAAEEAAEAIRKWHEE